MPWRPTSLKPLGTALFRRDLTRWLDEQFEQRAEDQLRQLFACEQLPTSAAARRLLQHELAIEPLGLGEPMFHRVQTAQIVGPNLILGVELPFTGNPALFGYGAKSSGSRRSVSGVLDGPVLGLGVECRFEHRDIAELALTSDLELARERVMAQAPVLTRYHRELPKRCREHVQHSWERHEARRFEYRKIAKLQSYLNEAFARRMAQILEGMSFD